MPHYQGKPAEICTLRRRAVPVRCPHVNHPHHADGNHPGPNPANLFARLFEFIPFYIVREMRSNLQNFRVIARELLRVAIGVSQQYYGFRDLHVIMCSTCYEILRIYIC